MTPSRRGFLRAAAPAVILTPRLLMPVKAVLGVKPRKAIQPTEGQRLVAIAREIAELPDPLDMIDHDALWQHVITAFGIPREYLVGRTFPCA